MAEGASDSHGSSLEHIVFVNTSLGMHVAVMVSDDDTVGDLKKKILDEHARRCFTIGKIKILAVKVKRMGHFYRLPDNMPITSVFKKKAGKGWFIHVDVCALEEEQRENQLPCNPQPSKEFLPNTTTCAAVPVVEIPRLSPVNDMNEAGNSNIVGIKRKSSQLELGADLEPSEHQEINVVPVDDRNVEIDQNIKIEGETNDISSKNEDPNNVIFVSDKVQPSRGDHESETLDAEETV